MRWRSAPHARFPIARRQVKMTWLGRFRFARVRRGEGRPARMDGAHVGSVGRASVRGRGGHRRAGDRAACRLEGKRSRGCGDRRGGALCRPAFVGAFGRCERACANCGTRGRGHSRHHHGDRRPRRVGGGYVGALCGAPVSNPEAIKRVSARLLSGGRVALYSDMPISGQPPEGVDIASDRARADIVVSPFAGANEGASVRVAETTGKVVPAGETGKPAGVRAQAPAPEPLRLVVPCIVAGIGCRRGACAEAIEEAFLLACGQAGISPSAVRKAATIDVKAHEEGLLAFCRARNIPLATYSADELSQVEGSVSPSDFVRATVGVDNVCERAALADGGKLIFPKLAHGGVTVAFSKVTIELSFKER